MKDKSKNIKQKEMQDVRFMDARYFEPMVSYPRQSSLFTKTNVLINSFFDKKLPNSHVPRYLSGARLNK